MRRREFITMVGSAATWPLAARAQQAERVRRIGFLSTTNENNQLARAQTTLLEALTKLGWVEGRNLRIDLRGAADRDRLREYAAELVKLSPRCHCHLAPTMAAQQETRTIPIVVSGVGDPLAVGLVKSIARPEGNI